jgi:peptide/nickel transport system permease protein
MNKSSGILIRFSKSWLVFFFITSVIAAFFGEEIQRHDLDRALRFGFDPFGRNCLLLSLHAAVKSMIEIIPLGFSCIAITLGLSFLCLIRNETFRFFWNALWEALYSLPGFILAISLTAFFPNTGLTFPLAVLFLLIPWLIRFFEGQILSLLNREYVRQSVSLGAHPIHLFRIHILPELLEATKAILPFLVSRLLIIETSLTFVGMKQPDQTTSWGELLYLGKDYLLEAPWISFFSALPLFLTLFSFHLISKNEHS